MPGRFPDLALARLARPQGAPASLNTVRTRLNPVRVRRVSQVLVVLSAQMSR